ALDGRPLAPPPSPLPEAWPFSGRGQENIRKPPLAAAKEQKENIFHSGGFAAAVKNHLLFMTRGRSEAHAETLRAKRPKLRGGVAAKPLGEG
ncbi:MAG: hypothetical protein N2556_04765, partial [Anaerolineae bacterium]|nr:hypothetical protein [Anaerolineae bacterium]